MKGVCGRWTRQRCALCAFVLVFLMAVHDDANAQCVGKFEVVAFVGISPITVAQSIDGKLYLLDRSDLFVTKIPLPGGTYAHAVEYDIKNNTYRALSTATNTWCSAGGYLPDGTIINTAGNDLGLTGVRLLRPCSVPNTAYVGGGGPAACNDWWEDKKKLALNISRWYPTSQTLPDGTLVVVGGSPALGDGVRPNYEIVDPWNVKTGRLFDLPFIWRVTPNHLYPFVHLLPSNRLFIFASVEGIVLNYLTNTVDRNVPKIPDGISRNHYRTGASLLMPISYNDNQTSEILICGGTSVLSGAASPSSATCWLCKITELNITWTNPFNMTNPRVVPSMVYLADGKILVLNGAQVGIGGFGLMSKPNFTPELIKYTPRGITIQSDLCPSQIARGYHSEALLVPDGRVFVTGSNPNGGYVNITGYAFNSEYRIETFSPTYLTQTIIPRLTITAAPSRLKYGSSFSVMIKFLSAPSVLPSTVNVRVAFISNAFTTHSLSMGLRYIKVPFEIYGAGRVYKIFATSPPNSVIAPPNPYMLAVTYRDIPGVCRWIIIR